MDLQELMKHILLLPDTDKQKILQALMEEAALNQEGHYNPIRLSNTPAWKEMMRRAEEVIREEKTCLIHFDDHMQSLN